MATTTTSSVSKVGSSYYKTSVTSSENGTLNATTYRTNATGGNAIPISTTSSDGTRAFTSNATAAEQTSFSNPNSAERQAYSQQVQSLKPYGDNPTAAQQQQVGKLSGGSGNAAATGESNASLQQQGQNAQQDIERSQGDTNNGDPLVYPRNRQQSGGDYIHFEMRTYAKSGFVSEAGSFTQTRMEDRKHKPLAHVYLPIQSGIVDSISVDWGNGELNPMTAQFANLAMGTIIEAGKNNPLSAAGNFVDNFGAIADKFLGANSTPDLQKLVANYFTERAIGTPGLLSRSVGGAINNNLELLFNGPTLRSFTFNFKLTPREKAEAEDIKKIIRLFKRGMSPALSKSGLFLAAPNVFKIKYVYTDKGDKSDPHPYLNRIKVAALRDFSVNYTPDGNFMTYADGGSMTQYDLSMTFGEIDPVYADDYDDEQGKTGMGW